MSKAYSIKYRLNNVVKGSQFHKQCVEWAEAYAVALAAIPEGPRQFQVELDQWMGNMLIQTSDGVLLSLTHSDAMQIQKNGTDENARYEPKKHHYAIVNMVNYCQAQMAYDSEHKHEYQALIERAQGYCNLRTEGAPVRVLQAQQVCPALTDGGEQVLYEIETQGKQGRERAIVLQSRPWALARLDKVVQLHNRRSLDYSDYSRFEIDALYAAYLSSRYGNNLTGLFEALRKGTPNKPSTLSDKLNKSRPTHQVKLTEKLLSGRFVLTPKLRWHHDKLVIMGRMPETLVESLVGEPLERVVDLRFVPGLEQARITECTLNHETTHIVFDNPILPLDQALAICEKAGDILQQL